MEQVRTRIAPSPTGFPHIGTIYQAMFDYVMAKKYQGQFIIRIEDTDRSRLVKDAEWVIFESLDWFNLKSDENPIKGGPFGPYRQSERLDIYKKNLQTLIDQGQAYYCFCTKERLEQMRKDQEAKKMAPMYDKHCRNLPAEEVKQKLEAKTPYVVRMKVPENQTIVVEDSLVGKVKFNSNLIDDQVLLKADGFPTYHLAVVVDDYLMKITHVIRGKEWLPSTPKYILLCQFFGWEKFLPKFTHLPVILNADGKGKLSKRDGHASVDYYKQEGFLPEAILNYLSNIVWNHPEGKEIYDLKELEKAIDINGSKIINVTSQAPRFDLKKLEWINGEYIRKMSDVDLTQRLQEFLVDHPNKDKIAPLVPLVKERIKKLSDFVPLTDFIFEKPEYDLEVFQKLGIEQKNISTADLLNKVTQKLEQLKKPWTQAEFESSFRQLATEVNLPAGTIFQLIRVTISGQTVTPPLLPSIKVLGEDKSLDRIRSLAQKYPNLD